jgi:hypothetical protein
LVLEELLTITVKTLFWFVVIGGNVDHHCKNFLFKERWSTIPPISKKQRKVYQREMVNNSTNIKKTKESLNCDSVDIEGIVDHHC